MGKYVLLNRAVADLGEIWNFTVDHWSEAQADKYYGGLLEALAAIAENPGEGGNYEEIHPGLRGVRVGRHIVFYRLVSESGIEVVRVLHERMDLKHQLQGGQD